MRQAGILAAAGLYALDYNVDRLAEDHANARLFADRLSAVPGIVLDPPEVETNLVFFNVEKSGPSAKDISDRLLEKGIRIGIEDEFRMRLVTHLDVDRNDIEEAAEVLTNVITHP
jgi:threonine aldolase